MKTDARRKPKQAERVYVLEFRAPNMNAWLVSIDAMAFTRKDAAESRASAYMHNTPHIHYRVATFRRERGGQP